jgi:crotonobetainyl-CoA:carnitine CoA-transferase CaiB-like acyl-CoA transferase
MTTAKGALSHLKVLDLSRILAGPWAGQTLADLGADVIKVEKPGAGDDTRGWGPPWLPDSDGNPTTDAAYYLAANRNKRSMTVDFTQPEGQKIVRKLAADSDILIENYKLGGLAKYGLDYASLSAINPRLIYCSITGFGQTGPYAARPGYDLLLQAMGGLMSITGEPSSPPQRVGVAVVDLMSGLYATIGILAALSAREKTGRGQHIDLALLDVEVACLANQGMNYLMTGTSPAQSGNAHPNIVPYQDFPTSDGAMIVAVGNDGQFARFANALGAPEWAGDERYATNGARVINRAGLVAMIAERTAERTTKDWVALLEAANVPCGPINRIADVFADPQVQARGMKIALDHPVGGAMPSIASPLRLSDTPVSYHSAPPVLGQNTAEILAERLGLDGGAIARLMDSGIV